jgi:hypothetical protein
MILADCPVWTVGEGLIMNEQLTGILDILRKAVEDGRNVTIKATDLSIETASTGCQLAINEPEITIE